jgi:hypothetical protein
VQHATGRLVGVDAPVEALMADAGMSIDFEVATDLLWTLSLLKRGFDHGPCLVRNAMSILTGPHAGL